jgi:RNA polymerase subunit RPABC4/transcription elongation factor Spt4
MQGDELKDVCPDCGKPKSASDDCPYCGSPEASEGDDDYADQSLDEEES